MTTDKSVHLSELQFSPVESRHHNDTYRARLLGEFSELERVPHRAHSRYAVSVSAAPSLYYLTEASYPMHSSFVKNVLKVCSRIQRADNPQPGQP